MMSTARQVSPEHRRSQQITACGSESLRITSKHGRCIRSHQIISDRIGSYPIASDRIRSHQIVSDRIRSYPIASDRIRSHRIVSDRIRSERITVDSTNPAAHDTAACCRDRSASRSAPRYRSRSAPRYGSRSAPTYGSRSAPRYGSRSASRTAPRYGSVADSGAAHPLHIVSGKHAAAGVRGGEPRRGSAARVRGGGPRRGSAARVRVGGPRRGSAEGGVRGAGGRAPDRQPP